MSSSWKDCGVFWEHSAPQGTEEWKNARKGRINSSNSGSMSGQNNFKTPEEAGKIIAGVEEDNFSQKSIEVMAHGTKYEPYARNWYEKKYNCKATERGLCVSKYDITIGASVDGDIIGTDKIIEIKSPQKMYTPILNYLENIDHGWKPEKNYVDHIWKSHFCQIQHAMFVLDKKYCDYIVYCTSTSQIFTQRIKFDPDFWKQHYLKIKENYKLYVQPYLAGTPYPIIPYCVS